MAELLILTPDTMAPFIDEDGLSEKAFQLTENPDVIEFTADVAGFDDDEIQLVLDGNQLTVIGYHEENAAETEMGESGGDVPH